MNTYYVRVYVPVYYELTARNAEEARTKAEALFQQAQGTQTIPTVEVMMEEGVGVDFWDGVDSAIDDYKERHL